MQELARTCEPLKDFAKACKGLQEDLLLAQEEDPLAREGEILESKITFGKAEYIYLLYLFDKFIDFIYPLYLFVIFIPWEVIPLKKKIKCSRAVPPPYRGAQGSLGGTDGTPMSLRLALPHSCTSSARYKEGYRDAGRDTEGVGVHGSREGSREAKGASGPPG